MSGEHSADYDAACPACSHPHPDADCDCGCEWDSAFCGVCGWLDCECPIVSAEELEPAFGLIGGPECPTCLGLGHRCHPDGGLISCVEGCDRCEAAVEDRAIARGPIKWTDEGLHRLAVDLGLVPDDGEQA